MSPSTEAITTIPHYGDLDRVAAHYLESVSSVEVEPQQTDAELFAGHVVATREKGDALDAIARYSDYTRGLALPAVTGVVLGETAATALTSNASGIVIIAALSSAAVATAAYTKRIERAVKTLEARRGVPSEEALGESYDLYRVYDETRRRHEIVLRWYGAQETKDANGKTVDAKPVQESLSLVAELASTYDIKTVMIEPSLLGNEHGRATGRADAIVATGDWMRRRKNLPVRFSKENKSAAAHELLIFTPAKLQVLAHEMGHKRVELSSLDRVIDVLRLKTPFHPLVRQFDEYRKYPELLLRSIESTARTGIERNLHDVDAEAGMNDIGIPTRRKLHLSGVIVGEEVEWRQNGLMRKRQPLSAALGIGQDELAKIIAHPDMHQTQKVISAAEYTSYLFARKALEVRSPAEDAVSIKPDTSLIVAASSERRQVIKGGGAEAVYASVKRPRNLHKLLVTAIVVAAASGTAYAEKVVHDRSEAVIEAGEVAWANMLNVPVKQLNEAQLDSAEAYALSQVPPLAIHNSFETARNDVMVGAENVLVSATDTVLGEGGDGKADLPGWGDFLIGFGSSGVGDGTSQVGNVQNNGGEPITEWNLEAHGGATTDGYWTSDVGYILYKNGEWGSHKITDEYNLNHIEFLPHTPSPSQQEYIQVSRDLDGIDSSALPLWAGGHQAVVHIPVLTGMEPIAAEFNDDPLSVFQKSDGTFALALSPSQIVATNSHAELTYYVASVEQELLPPHATQPNQFQPMADGAQRQTEMDKIWSAYREPHPRTEQDRLLTDVAHIHDNFTYEYAPLDDSVDETVQDEARGWGAFAATQLKKGTANCNVAATLVALDNPQVNAAWGYANDGDTRLLGSEAHMWVVDRYGAIYDPTPPHTEEDGASLRISNHLGSLTLGGGLLMAGGLAWAGRRLLQDGLRHGVRTVARHQLNGYSTQELAMAKLVADRATYAKHFDADAFATKEITVSRAAALRDLGKHQVHSTLVREHMAAARASAVSDRDKKLLSSAEKTIKVVRRVGLVVPVEPAKSLDGVL